MDWNRILKQAQAATQTKKSKAAIARYNKKLNEAGEKFIEILKNKITQHAGSNYASGELGETAIAAARDVSISGKRTNGSFSYIDITFNGNLHRESLAPGKYRGIDNIVALLNTGYHAGHTVAGVWKGHGEDIVFSLKDRAGAHFIQEAKEEFMTKYAEKYGVIDIVISDEYE